MNNAALFIEYRKLRSEQYIYNNKKAQERLTHASRLVNAGGRGDEAVAYWMQVVEKTNNWGEWQMLFKAFESIGDMTGAYQFLKSRISRNKMLYDWDWVLENLNGVDSIACELVNTCKGALQQDRSNETAALALVKASRSLREVEARITQLKSALPTLKLNFGELEESDVCDVGDVREVLVEDLTQAIIERRDEK